jgi:hypothetical protein
MYSAVVDKEEAKVKGRIASLKHYHAHKGELIGRWPKTDASSAKKTNPS